jgi:hypothetical protein
MIFQIIKKILELLWKINYNLPYKVYKKHEFTFIKNMIFLEKLSTIILIIESQNILTESSRGLKITKKSGKTIDIYPNGKHSSLIKLWDNMDKFEIDSKKLQTIENLK